MIRLDSLHDRSSIHHGRESTASVFFVFSCFFLSWWLAYSFVLSFPSDGFTAAVDVAMPKKGSCCHRSLLQLRDQSSSSTLKFHL